jgi:hypothetical protein
MGLMVRRIAALALLFALFLITVSGCRGSDATGESSTVPAVGSDGSERSVAPDYGSSESTASDYGSDESTGSDYGSNEPNGSAYGSDDSTASDSGSSTDPCAFQGDQLCPDTPVKVPPPNISNWP